MFIGEWNPVFERLGGGHLMRQYFDRYAEYGWAATMWSAKILEPGGGSITDNWHLYTNAEPRPEIDFETASVAEIEAWFRWLGEMEYAVDEPMRAALTRPDPLRVPMPTPEPTLTEPPANDPVPGCRELFDATA